MQTPDRITTEQINDVPLLLGIIEQMGIRDLIDSHVKVHGSWQGASVGTLVSVWLCCLLSTRDHRLVAVRDWAFERRHTLDTLLGVSLRETDCTDDRLANVLGMLGEEATQQALDQAMVSQWLSVYALPTRRLRLDSTSVSVYHRQREDESLLQFGQSKDHRPDLSQFKSMLASLDPLGMPVCVQTVAGNAADDGLYVPAYQAAVRTLGTSDLLVVGDCKMGALGTRAQIARNGSRYLCVYRPPSATEQIAGWIEGALARKERALRMYGPVDARTREPRLQASVEEWERPQSWTDPDTGEEYRWTERVLLVHSQAYQAGHRKRLEGKLACLREQLKKLRLPPKRGRKGYLSEADLAAVVTKRLQAAGLEGVVGVRCEPHEQAGKTYWLVTDIAVDALAFEAKMARLGWQVYVTNATPEEYATADLVHVYSQQPIQERGFSRLKTRTLRVRPVYLRDEQRIGGLMWLLCLALRVLTLTEWRLRGALSERNEQIVGLNPASRTQPSANPTTERVLAAFGNLTWTRLHFSQGQRGYVSPLTPTQRHVLQLLKLPADLYDRLAHCHDNFTPILRE